MIFEGVIWSCRKTRDRFAFTVIFSLVIILYSSALAEVDVNGWRKLSQVPQIGYMAGVLDTAINIRELSERVAQSQGISIDAYWMQHPDIGLFGSAACPSVTRLPLDQKLAILNKYVDQNPEVWGGPMSLMIVGAFEPICRK